MLTHAGLMANVVQLRHWLEDLVDGREVVMCALGLWHSYGITACMNLGLSVAATLVLLARPETPGLLRLIVRHRPTIFPGVPEMYLGINIHPNVRRYDLKSIRTCVSGAAPLPLEVQEVFERLTRGRLVEGYGLTEAGPVTHVNPFYGLRKPGCIGVPLPDTDARILDPHTHQPLPAGAAGELAVRGPQVMKGYWNNPALTAEKLRDGWLLTGDLACMDADGFFRIIDRLKDVIALDDGNICPREIEEVLYENPGVHEVAVAPGTLDGRSIVVAYVVPNPGMVITETELIAFCRGRMPEHAVPARVEIRASLPKTYMGKIARAGLSG
jgi:long-chain acyl-CoA synthetase